MEEKPKCLNCEVQNSVVFNVSEMSLNIYNEPLTDSSFNHPSTTTYEDPVSNLTKSKLAKVARLSTVMEKVQLKSYQNIHKKVMVLPLISKDVQRHVANLLANIFRDNRCKIDGKLIMPEGELPGFMKMIVDGLKAPKYPKRKMTLEQLGMEFDEMEKKESRRSIEGESTPDEGEWVEDEELNKGDFVPFIKEEGYLKCSIIDEIVPDISNEPWYWNYKLSHMRFHRLKNQPKPMIPKMKADDLVLTYNPNMVRHSGKPNVRTEREQARRDKNTLATRVSRTRAKHNEEQINIQAAFYDNANILIRRENACLITYLDKLTESMGAQPRNWTQITEEIMAKEFMDEQAGIELKKLTIGAKLEADEEDNETLSSTTSI